MSIFRRKKEEEITVPRVLIADNPMSIASEQFRTIRTNIQFSMVDERLQTISITSADAASGKSTIAANLAGAFATDENKVLLVDADMRKPTVHKTFRVQNGQGLTNLLTDRSLNLEDVVRKSYVENLSYITCGVIPPNPSDLLNSQRMTEVVEAMKDNFDLIIFDNPPVLPVTDAQIMAGKVDGTVVVIPEGQVTKDDMIKTANSLKKVNANVLGTVMNKTDSSTDDYYYYGEE